jgi:tetratricopeptide (TPR) repeat protein
MPSVPAQQREPGAAVAVRLLAAVFLLVHVVARLLPHWPAWGLDSLRYYPPWMSLLCVLAAVPLLWPRAGEFLRDATSRPFAGHDPWQPGRQGWLDRGLLLGCLLLLFAGLRSAIHLLGDGLLYTSMLRGDGMTGVFLAGNEPLGHALAATLFRVGGPLELSAAGAYGWSSILSGLIYVGAALACARWLTEERGLRLLVLGLLLTSGLLQLFCGYVETYAPAVALLLLYVALALRALQGRGSLYPAALVLGIAIATHFTIAVYLPSLVVLGVIRSAGTGLRRAGRMLGPPVVSLLLACGIALALGWRPSAYLQGLRASHFLPLSGSGDRFQPYSLFSWAHLHDVLNQLLLVAPAALLALPVLLRRSRPHSPTGRFLLAACLPPLLAVLLLNPEIGAFRDWDLFALPAVPLLVVTALALRQRLATGRAWQRVGWVIVWAAAWHSVLWIGVNSRAEAAESRFVDNLQQVTLSRHARAYGWETLGSFYETHGGDTSRALAAYERALAADERNPRLWNLAGTTAAALGQREKAVRFLEQAVDRQQGSDPRHLNNLALALADLGRPDEAIAALQRAVALQPKAAESHHNLGIMLARRGRLEEAVQEFRAGLAHAQGSGAIAADLALALAQLGRQDEAIAVLTSALARVPGDEKLSLVLGRVLMASGRPADAVEVFQAALARHSRSVELNLQLGLVYGLLGQPARAAPHLRRVLQLQPDHPQAAAIRQLLQGR